MALVPKAFPNAAEADAQPDYIYKIFNDNVVNEITLKWMRMISNGCWKMPLGGI